ncbi:putative transposase [Geodermatophilus siccatus]|uniref:Putative transposase n=1 Tax=Geodermatophilus siccatus TaxID=1137991 RepID=A0A1H0B793_9ACTN|nr:putative transposase [Geodermatophilus siccatus]
MSFIEAHADRRTDDGLRWGVEPICRVLTEHGTPIAPSTYYDARDRPSSRAVRDEQLKAEITRVHQANYGVYGARKAWLALNREGIGVARCTVERLMRELGLEGARRGTRRRTTVTDPAAPRPADLVQRRFSQARPDAVWVADFTYVATWSGTVYVAFVLDAHSRRILGWRAARSMKTELVLDALEQAIWTRGRAGVTDLSGLVCHNDAGSQYISIAFTERLVAAGAAPSVGTVGDALDNALAETHIGLFKTELIHRRGPWKGLDDVELATLEWVDWHNNRRLHTACHDLTPVEYEQVFYGQHPAQQTVGVSQP